MILRITFQNDATSTMLFGDGYKPWKLQFEEYVHRHGMGTSDVLRVEKSKSAWKNWGGLKWCHEDSFQQELNREGCQQDDPDASNPRQYSRMRFVDSEKDFDYVRSYLLRTKNNKE